MQNQLAKFGMAPGVLAVAAAALLGGCGGAQSSAALSPFVPRQAGGDVALTMPHYVRRTVHPDRSVSSVSPNAKAAKMLLYVGDWSTNDVYLYDYKSGAPVGTLTGNDEPYGMCVDAKGDMYVANFGSGTVNEYAHGGTLIQSYSTAGELIGCAVDAKGDVAATSFDPGDVTVFAKGNPEAGTTYSDSACEYMWTMGYDDNGNLVGIGEYSSIAVCALLAGSKTMTTLQTIGFTVWFAGGTTWDGKYLALGDQEVGGKYESGVARATLKGNTLTFVSSTTFSDNCDSDYTDDVNPFIVGKKNTPANRKQGNAMVGPNLWCIDAGAPKVDYWHYPAGGLPYNDLSSPPDEPYGAGVSIAQ
ncbi:MAG TPA: SMP-30/gluconolactonase/LRE family protein [Candidatus Cybelea sp.]|nr:SMP-30/gluconolactonase/LRE family protein [Candidatus Cybelea sp.]